MHLLPSSPEASISHVFLSQALFVWLLSESHHSGREAQNSRGWGRPADLHVGCWAVRSVVPLNHPLACGMEAASSCMPVVRARPTHPQLFLSSSPTLFHFLSLFLSIFLTLFPIQLSFRVLKYLEMQRKHRGRWNVDGKLSVRGKIAGFTSPSPLNSTWSYSTKKLNIYFILLLCFHYSYAIIYYDINNFLVNVFDLFSPHTVCFEACTSYFWLVCCNIILVTQEYLSIFSLVVNCTVGRKCLTVKGINNICNELNSWCYFWISKKMWAVREKG